jgi:hypothetical protein
VQRIWPQRGRSAGPSFLTLAVIGGLLPSWLPVVFLGADRINHGNHAPRSLLPNQRSSSVDSLSRYRTIRPGWRAMRNGTHQADRARKAGAGLHTAWLAGDEEWYLGTGRGRRLPSCWKIAHRGLPDTHVVLSPTRRRPRSFLPGAELAWHRPPETGRRFGTPCGDSRALLSDGTLAPPQRCVSSSALRMTTYRSSIPHQTSSLDAEVAMTPE